MASQQSSDQRRSDEKATSGAAEGVADRVAETVGGAINQAGDIAERTAAKGREAAASLKDVSVTMKEAVDTSLKQQPLTTLTVAAALGFVLGALWKS